MVIVVVLSTVDELKGHISVLVDLDCFAAKQVLMRNVGVKRSLWQY